MQSTQAEEGTLSVAVAPPEGEGRLLDLHHMFVGSQGQAGLSRASGFPLLAQGGGEQ